jgi:tRNA A37 methylthiotransferase MiaB
MIETFKRN